MAELLFELGVEELPASFVAGASRQLADEIQARLTEERVGFGGVEVFSTPRRLIVAVHGLDSMQPDSTKDMRGPGVKAAYDANQQPTPALLGFCRGQGVDPKDLRTEGDYVWVTKHISGKPTSELLPAILEGAVRALKFDKTMRWGTARMRFARPIRWILAALDGQLVEMSIESVTSGLTSRGHRFNFPEEFEARTLDQLLTELRSRNVEPDPLVRRERILSETKQAASGSPVMTEELLDENTHLSEWPSALEGEFKSDFLELPEPVLITAMAKHERFFPVRGTDGKLLNRFISIRGGGEEATVRSGNEWVLNARFNDAKFFFDEDKKLTFDDFLARTDRMSFQEKLGSVRQRADRLAALCAYQASAMGLDPETARLAGLYAKADLSTGLVSELSSLQGVIGGEYARRAGMPSEVADAIACQYRLSDLANDATSPILGMLLARADQLDKLAGYLGLGLAPSGSSDPYGLRRAATFLIEAGWTWPGLASGDLEAITTACRLIQEAGLPNDAAKAVELLQEIYIGRYKALLSDHRYDLVEAAMMESEPTELLNSSSVRFRVLALELGASDTAFVQAATRPLNIVAAARKKSIDIPSHLPNPSDLDSAEGIQLLEAGEAAAAQSAKTPEDLISTLRKLQAPIDVFFDSTMVMVEDERVRSARLAMLDHVGRTLLRAGDWTKVVLE